MMIVCSVLDRNVHGKRFQDRMDHHTFNPWWGCRKVSPACLHCYAETWATRLALDLWGGDASRRYFKEEYWHQPLKWNREAERARCRRRVFCASMADVFEGRSELDKWRSRLWLLIEQTPWLDWLLLTSVFTTSPGWCRGPRNGLRTCGSARLLKISAGQTVGFLFFSNLAPAFDSFRLNRYCARSQSPTYSVCAPIVGSCTGSLLEGKAATARVPRILSGFARCGMSARGSMWPFTSSSGGTGLQRCHRVSRPSTESPSRMSIPVLVCYTGLGRSLQVGC